MAKGFYITLFIFTYLNLAGASDSASCLIQHDTLIRKTAELSHRTGTECGTECQKDILIIGDSWGKMSGSVLANACKGKTVVNKAVSSSTAQEWNAGSCPDLEDDSGGNKCNFASAFSGNTYTHVWLTIGGNDWLGQDCSLDVDTLEARLRTMIGNIDNAADDAGSSDIKIVIGGYCTPKEQVSPNCNSGTMIHALQEAIANAVTYSVSQGIDATFVDFHYACDGGTEDAPTFSSAEYYADNIHVNAKGYCQVFSQDAFQDAMGCAAQDFDCDEWPASVPGFNTEKTCLTCAGCTDGVICHTFEDVCENQDDAQWCGDWEAGGQLAS